MARSRTKNVSINTAVALFAQIINLLVNFAARTVFIRTLGADYLGVNGLFANVLTILSFAELGIGHAIVFSMYKPLAVGDNDKLGSLMRLYKKAYNTIGFVVAGCGLCVAPFLDYVIKDKPDIAENMTLLYLLFLFNTVASYFFVYKKSIIIADQKSYITVIVTEGVHILQVAAQIVFLYLTNDFVLFLVTQILCTLINNIIASVIANRLYPFLKNRSKPLDKSESKNIFKNVRALAVYKFGSVILNGTDNILVSALVGVTEVGLVSNYTLLNASCKTILSKITEGFTASIGNLNAIGDDSKKYEVFNKIFFITSWLYGFASVGLLTVTTPFINAWIGSEYLLDDLTSFGIVAGFFVNGVHYAAYTYRTTLGLFVQGKVAPLAAAILNLVLSVLMCKWIGLAGIFIATPIARMLTTGIVDPVLIYRRIFKKNVMLYYLQYFGYVALFTGIGAVCWYLNSLINIGGWIGVIIRVMLVTVVFNLIMIVIFARTKMFKELFKSLLSVVSRKKKKQ